MSDSVHISVLLEEVMRAFASLKGKIIVDGTLGGGGHARSFLLGGAAKVIGFDWDVRALERCKFLSEEFEGRVTLVHAAYDKIEDVLSGAEVDGILLDLGFSSDQLDDAERGISYHLEGPLDMRLDSTKKATAADVLNNSKEEELADIFFIYGEEPKARVLAREVVRERKLSPLQSVSDLLRVVEVVYPARGQKRAHPAARIFQALRVAVNDELRVLERALPAAARCLKVGGKLAVITFQPMEERLVKRVFRDLCQDSLDSVGRVVAEAPFKMGKKVVPGEDELEHNPRARSAILRVLERTS